MKSPHRARLLPLFLLFPAALAAQSDTQALAAAVVRSMAPATDDPDAAARDLVATALQHGRSPAAHFLVEEAMRRLTGLQQPATLRDLVRGAPAESAWHGLFAQRLHELRWFLDRAVDGPAPLGPDNEPFAGYALQVLAVGPFGDEGDHFAGVPFGPELQFPPVGATAPGRGVTARTRLAQRERDQRRIELADPALGLAGCYYALQRVEVMAATAAYLEVDCDGDFQVFVDGAEVLRVQPWLEPGPARRYVPLQVPAGVHEAVVKTCSAERHAVGLRWTDPTGATHAGIRSLPADAPAGKLAERATTEAAPLPHALDVLLRAAAAAGAPAAVRIAALRCANVMDADLDALVIAEALRREPPADSTEQFAWAEAVTGLDLPDELRAAEARAIEEKAIATAPREHHHARIAEARLLEQQDRREDAIRLLAALPAAGPATWAYRHALAQRLHFEAENEPLLRQWARACPRDGRPLSQLASLAADAGDLQQALDLYGKAAALRPDQSAPLRSAFDLALDAGRFEDAVAWLDRLHPLAAGEAPSFARLRTELRIAARRGDRDSQLRLLRALRENPRADTGQLERCATQFAELGQPDEVKATLQQSLRLDSDQPTVKAWLAQLGERPPAGADFAAFRRDGDAARAAFVPSDREKTATSTLVLDQRIVEFAADGSWLGEVHELRRINDLAGVEEHQTASAPAHADEPLFVCTIDKDGVRSVPPKVQGDYSLQRLQPGAFVEFRYRDRGPAPGPRALRSERFLFQSADAPSLLAELVVILPPQPRGELRGHELGQPAREETLPDGRKVLVYTQRDLPRLAQERLSPQIGEVVPFGEFGEDGAPFALYRETRVQLLRRTLPTPAVRAAAEPLFAGLPSDREKVAAAWAWSQKEIESGSAETATHALLRKKGNRFLVTVALLRAGGIEVIPTACRDERVDLAGGDDAVFQTGETHQMPGAMVPLADGSVVHLFVDAPRHWPLGAIPAGRSGTTVFAVRENGVELAVLPQSRDAAQQFRARGRAVVDGTAVKLDAEIEVGDVQGYGLAERIRELKEDVRKQAARQIAQQLLPGWRVQQAKIVTDRPGEPFQLQCSAQRTCVQPSGDRFLVPLPMPPGKFLASFGDRAERTLPVRLATEVGTDWDITLAPGADHRFAEVPAPVFVQHETLLYQLTMQRDGDGLRVRRTAQVRPTTMPKQRFAGWLQALASADRADQVSLQLVARPQ